VWERARHVLRLRQMLLEFFPAALLAFADLDAPDALELLGRALHVPYDENPARGSRLARSSMNHSLGTS
jgi:hypothetical protein